MLNSYWSKDFFGTKCQRHKITWLPPVFLLSKLLINCSNVQLTSKIDKERISFIEKLSFWWNQDVIPAFLFETSWGEREVGWHLSTRKAHKRSWFYYTVYWDGFKRRLLGIVKYYIILIAYFRLPSSLPSWWPQPWLTLLDHLLTTQLLLMEVTKSPLDPLLTLMESVMNIQAQISTKRKLR